MTDDPASGTDDARTAYVLTDAIAVRETKEKGRGIFATRPLAEGVLLERAPVIVIPAHEVPLVCETVLQSYHFRWGGLGEESAVALGWASLYNHAHEPNAMYVKKYEARVIEFVTLRAIEAGEEITVSYNGGFGDDSPVWFEVK